MPLGQIVSKVIHITGRPQSRQGLRVIRPCEMSNSPKKLMYGGYFSSEYINIAPVNYPKYIKYSLNVYKITPVKPEIAPVK